MALFQNLIGPDSGDASIPQYCLRAALVFALGLACIRLAGRRTFAQASPLDIIVAILIGSNLSRMMTGKSSFLGGLAATLVIVLLHRALAMATIRPSPLASLIKCEPVILVRDAVIDRRMLDRHEVSSADLMEALRLAQIDDLANVKLATLENGGKISVIRRRPRGEEQPYRQRKGQDFHS